MAGEKTAERQVGVRSEQGVMGNRGWRGKGKKTIRGSFKFVRKGPVHRGERVEKENMRGIRGGRGMFKESHRRAGVVPT